MKWLIKSIEGEDGTLIVSKFTMRGYKNYQDALEETPMEETITISLEEYQRMKDVVTSMERVKGEEKTAKVWLIARIYSV